MKIVETNSTFTAPPGLIKEYDDKGKLLSKYTIYSTPSVANTVSRSYGANFPNWRERLRTHKGAVTDLSVIEKSTQQLSLCYYRQVNKNSTPGYRQRVTLEGNFSPTSALVDLNARDLIHADNEAKLNYLGNINQKFRALQGLVTVGEIAETVSLILRPGRLIVSLTERLKRDSLKLRKPPKASNVRRASASSAKSFSDLWLTYAFGITPLLSDIDSAMLALSRIINGEDTPYEKVLGRGSLSSKTSSFIRTGNGGIEWSIIQEITTYGAVKYYGEVALEKGTMQAASRQLGIDFLSIVPAAWELIPFSFLVDYFTNIGEVLGSLSAPQSAVAWNAKGYILTKDIISKQTDIRPGPAMVGQGWEVTSGQGSEILSRSRILNRIPNVGYVRPTFEFPSIERFVSSWKRQANVLALAVAKVR